jgi:hypothetical protein
VSPAANGVAPATVGGPCQPRSMDKRTDELLMLTAVTATCTDCGGQRIFVPVDDTSPGGEFCCTSCDAAIFLLVAVDGDRVRSRVA